jgi:hypothetical protein
MSEPVPYLDGHCATHGRADQYHTLCGGGYRSQFGVEFVCSCPAHEANPLVLQGSEHQTGDEMWDNETSPRGAETPAGTDHRSILETNGG